MKLVVDGVDTVVVVDEFLPFKKNKVNDDVLAFGKTSEGENEIWMMILEKAIAKVCGSYEAMENQSVEHGFDLVCGGPSVNYKVDDYLKDITRADYMEERVDKLWKVIDNANKKGWVTTASTT